MCKNKNVSYIPKIIISQIDSFTSQFTDNLQLLEVLYNLQLLEVLYNLQLLEVLNKT